MSTKLDEKAQMRKDFEQLQREYKNMEAMRKVRGVPWCCVAGEAAWCGGEQHTCHSARILHVHRATRPRECAPTHHTRCRAHTCTCDACVQRRSAPWCCAACVTASRSPSLVLTPCP